MHPLDLDDATLVAFVDGELPAAQRAAVADALAQDPGVATRVELLRRSAVSLRRAYQSVLDEPVPMRLIRAVSEHRTREFARRRMAASWTGRLAGWLGFSSWRGLALVAAAAAIALAIGASFDGGDAGGYRMAGTGDTGPSARDEALARAMEAGTPGQAFDYTLDDIGVSGSVTVIADVAAAEGTSCRSFRDVVRNGASETSRFGIACRGVDGVWRSLAVPEAPAS